ncbi:MAG TPA: glycosyltransferase [Rhodothermales bacterium]|nr:glycosyltransferase [Rhodothermales bacterium]
MIETAYAAGVAILFVYGLNQLWLAWSFAKYRRRPNPHDMSTRDAAVLPKITVQLPIYNERYVVERLLDACGELSYPGEMLQIQVLDDSTDDSSALIRDRVAFWRSRGVDMVHVQRSERAGFKAGALDHGLQSATGDLIAIFDADFVPPREFLLRLVPHFRRSKVGMVQARWAYLNEGASFLTRFQALSLDAHFAVEQFARNRRDCFINFNGTAGIWRRECIEEAGGWEGDTLTEDLDLSYRAQLAGWSFVYDREASAPSELPVDVNAIRSQQFRWAKGSIQTARKLLGRLLHSRTELRVRLEGFFHLTAHVVFPVALIVALLHAPLVSQNATTGIPGELYFYFMSIGLVALGAVILTQVLAQRDLHRDWWKRLGFIPVFLAGWLGLALNNTLAVADALTGRTTPFVRTPKGSGLASDNAPNWWKSRYADIRVPVVAWIELALAGYAFAGMVVIILQGQWISVPFQALFAAGFGLISLSNLSQLRSAKVQRRHLTSGDPEPPIDDALVPLPRFDSNGDLRPASTFG